ncbi:peripheral-type benzodiazepine receptor-associated protein 1 [Elysia marginata]|uniref:Peripheral-type benzodiazepine receptor-associated protein 1 n=1 Tax=Elysia marginata TaxID=1093978 RepID=A0AAV4HP79_9GAST|nr:peripheral-type benzodiazepine receptor-associated protein 1 [Elysia marginata]
MEGNSYQTRKEDREREKALQKKLGELTTQIQRLERRISLLRTENDTLRKKQDDQRPLEEKIKSLKKRNAELASIARRLEEKAKALQQENSKVRAVGSKRLSASLPGVDESSVASNASNATSSATPTPDSDHLRRVVARQRARDLAEHAKAMLAKDREIEDLRRKCQDLADQLSNGEISAPHNAAQFEEKEELVNIIKQAAKERLQLEQQLGHTRGGREKVSTDYYLLLAGSLGKSDTGQRMNDLT